MEEKLVRLRNTMLLIETKGESTKLMATCLNYLDQLVKEASADAARSATTDE